MFFNVLNMVISKGFQKPRLLLIIDLLPFAKLLELLAIDHSSSEKRITFVPRFLKFSHILVVL